MRLLEAALLFNLRVLFYCLYDLKSTIYQCIDVGFIYTDPDPKYMVRIRILEKERKTILHMLKAVSFKKHIFLSSFSK